MVRLQRVVVLLLLFSHWDLLPRQSPSGLREALSAETPRWRRAAGVIAATARTAKLRREEPQGVVRSSKDLTLGSS